VTKKKLPAAPPDDDDDDAAAAVLPKPTTVIAIAIVTTNRTHSDAIDTTVAGRGGEDGVPAMMKDVVKTEDGWDE